MTDEGRVESLRLTHFPTDGSAEWLGPKDLALACAVLLEFPMSDRRAVEVGVWKGAWSLGVLENVAGAEVIGVDPYPGHRGPEARGVLERRIAALRLDDRFSLAPSRAEAQAMMRPDSPPVVVHVDGEHTEHATAEDLAWAGDVLAPGGIVILDDHRHVWFPGIASAMHAFLRDRGFRIVLTTEDKAYLCRDVDHSGWYERFEQSLGDGHEIEWSHHYGERTGGISYLQRPDVLGRPVLLAIGGPTCSHRSRNMLVLSPAGSPLGGSRGNCSRPCSSVQPGLRSGSSVPGGEPVGG